MNNLFIDSDILIDLLAKRSNYNDALTNFQSALKITQKINGNHLVMSTNLLNIAACYEQMNENMMLFQQ